MNETKTVYITRNALFKDISMLLCNNITKIDESFIENNFELFFIDCENCNGSGEVKESEELASDALENADIEYTTCPDCSGDGRNDSEPYQYFLCDLTDWKKERLSSYGVEVGYSELLDLHVMPIYDYGTGWNAFSYSKEVDVDYQLGYDETLSRTTIY